MCTLVDDRRHVRLQVMVILAFDASSLNDMSTDSNRYDTGDLHDL